MTAMLPPPNVVLIEDSAFRGDTVLFELTVIRQGQLADLQGNWWCTGKWWRSSTSDQDALFQISGVVTPMGVITNPSPGVLHIRINPAASAGLPPLDSPVQIDVQWQDPVGDIWTIASGTLTFLADVTRSGG